MKCPTTFLLEGMASLFYYGDEPSPFNTSKSGREADYRALLSDWQRVGEDLWTAIGEFENMIVGEDLTLEDELGDDRYDEPE